MPITSKLDRELEWLFREAIRRLDRSSKEDGGRMMNGESGSSVTVQGGSAVAPPKATLRDNIEKEMAQLRDNAMSLSDRVETLGSLLLNAEPSEDKTGVDPDTYGGDSLLGTYANSIHQQNEVILRLTNTLDRIHSQHSLT